MSVALSPELSHKRSAGSKWRTMFLDEVGDIPLGLQPKLLRVLQEREIERSGSNRTSPVDVRLVAATNRDLAGMVEKNEFREDLYYRLNAFPIHVPPLRERSGDIPFLVRHFVQHFSRRMGKTIETIPAETMDALTQYRWPGNIRELQNLIERAVILSSGPVLEFPLADLNVRALPPQNGGKRQTLEQAERGHILATLNETKWLLSGPRGAATRLGLRRSTLQYRIKKLGIVKPWLADRKCDSYPQLRLGRQPRQSTACDRLVGTWRLA